jgi:hypothetical protein
MTMICLSLVSKADVSAGSESVFHILLGGKTAHKKMNENSFFTTSEVILHLF